MSVLDVVEKGKKQFGAYVAASKHWHATLAVCLLCSAGEVLGCTAPVVPETTSSVIFVADGRFHLEAIMIANPSIPAFRFAIHEDCLLSLKQSLLHTMKLKTGQLAEHFSPGICLRITLSFCSCLTGQCLTRHGAAVPYIRHLLSDIH